MDLLKELQEMFFGTPGLKVKIIRCEPVGSRVTCDPPVMNTDRDVLLLVDHLKRFCDAAGYLWFQVAHSMAEKGVSCFQSVKKGELNLIATDSDEFFKRFMAATYVAKRLNLLKRCDRVALFQAVLYGNECHNATARRA